MAQIYNQAIEDGASTFETRLRMPSEIHGWFDGKHPIVAVEHDARVIAYAATFDYSSRECYRGVAEFAVYVDRGERARGAGKLALAALFVAARSAGYWKLVSRIFPENAGVRKLGASMGVREVGVHRKHAQLAGQWRDVIVIERLLME